MLPWFIAAGIAVEWAELILEQKNWHFFQEWGDKLLPLLKKEKGVLHMAEREETKRGLWLKNVPSYWEHQ